MIKSTKAFWSVFNEAYTVHNNCRDDVIGLLGIKNKFKTFITIRIKMNSQVKWGSVLFAIMFTSILEGIDKNGNIVQVNFYSQALEGNLLGDSPNRDVFVYLPPSYEHESKKRYPAVYLLHGNSPSESAADFNPATRWVNEVKNKASKNHPQRGIQSIMDSLIANGKAEEMIIVMPNGRNKYRGSHYVNSLVTGNWADHIAKDLVDFIDDNFKTIKGRNSRALAGYSMGGRGTLILGMKYPDVYGVIYAMSGGVMNFHKLPSTPNNIEEWEKVLRLKNLENVDWRSIRTIGLSAAFSPNPKNEPFYADFQYRLENGKLKPVPEVQNRWQQFDPVRMVDNYKNALLKLNGFRFDCGRFDSLVLEHNRALVKKLKSAGIPHEYEEYDARHGEKRNLRLEQKVLPYLSTALRFEEVK